MDEVISELFDEWEVSDFLSRDEYATLVKDCYQVLVDNAKLGKVLFYGELPLFEKLKERFKDDVSKVVGVIVGACSEYEATRGRSLISAIIINQDTREPGVGFYGLSAVPYHLCRETWEEQGKKPPEIVITKRQEFWLSELKDTLDYWGKHEI